MSTGHQPPLHRIWHMTREYLTHWAIAGVIVTMTGFAPDHIVAHMIHALNLDHLRAALPALDYRLLTVGLGVALIAVDVMVLNRKRLSAAPTDAPPSPAAAEIEIITDKPSIAVLPFVNMSGDKEQEYLADGMTEDIITGLSYDSRLFVIARNSTFAYKGQSPDIRTLGRELGVRYVLEGSIRSMGERLRITAQLIETATGTHIWADKIDRPLAEIFDLMDEVVDGLVMALCSSLGVAEGKRAARTRPEDLQAWALCVQAESNYQSQLIPEMRASAETLVRRATEIEPAYAYGWALLSFLIVQRISMGQSTDSSKDVDEAVSLAGKALRISPADPLVLGYCGMTYTWSGNSAQAIDCLEHSLAINPNNGLFRLRHGFALWAAGEPEAGLAQLNHFFRLSPKDPLAGVAHVWSSLCYIALEEYAKAEQAARLGTKLMPSYVMGYVCLAIALSRQDRNGEAREAIRKHDEIAPFHTPERVASNFRLVIRHPQQLEKMVAMFSKVVQDRAAGGSV